MSFETNINKAAATTFVAVSAVILSLIHNQIPPSEARFATGTCVCCLAFFAAVADPETFYETLFTTVPFLRLAIPRRLHAHIQHSIECLREGERRVAELQSKKKGEPKDGVDYGVDRKVTNRMLLEEVRKRMQWRYVLPAILCGAVVKLVEYQKPKVIGQMTDAVLKEGATMDTAFWPFLRQLVMFVIVDYVFVSLREYCKHAGAHRYCADVRTDFLRNLLDQEADFINSDRHSAGFVHLFNRETNRLQKTVNQSLQRLVFALISLVLGVYTLCTVDARLALLGILVNSPILATLQHLSRRDIIKYSRLYDASSGDAVRLARSVLKPEVITLLQSYGAQRKLVDLYRAKTNEFINYLEYTHFRQTLLCMVNHGVRNAEGVLLTAMGLSSVLQRKITIGMYSTFKRQLNLLKQGPKELLALWNEILTIRMTAADYFELMYRESRIHCSDWGSHGPEVPAMADGGGFAVTLKNVSFSYRMNPDLKILDGFDLQLKPGKIVALCGGSGGGKTTITRLIQRFYDPTEGSCELNGVDIRSIDVAFLRHQIAVIDQDPILLDMTIAENIALGLSKKDSDRGKDYVHERVTEAAKLAEAHEFITTKTELGYDTPMRLIHRLSGGQRQRIAIARALITRAPILICDEVTSALDADTECNIIGTLFRKITDKSVLVIAHRLTTIRHADEIVFLEHGKVIERGTHEELLRLDGRYSSYVKASNGQKSITF